MSDQQEPSKPSRLDEFLADLMSAATDPIHKRILQVYQGTDPVKAMETELGQILLEVVKRED
jgi:hypothetical protein